MDRFFAAQCIKDDTMAESIARRIACDPGDPPVVIHWNGRFHSDYGLGTVERLRSRQPDLNIAVVSMLTDVQLSRPLADEVLNQGHYIILVQAPREGAETD
ncbi:ChaN family lipoprotein [Planctomycetota bacterium]|nr:ChaN family lipoprotein [Planctomycetota bacterium]